MQDLLDIAKRISKIPIETKVDPVRYRVYDEKELVADVSKMKGVIGWGPERGLDDSVKTILEYWREKVNYLFKENKGEISINNTRTKGEGESSNSRHMSNIAVCIRGYDRVVNNAENILESIVNPLAADVFAVVQTEDGAAPDLVTKVKAVAGDHKNYSPDEILAEMEADGFNKTLWLGIRNKNSLAPFGGSRGSALMQYKSLKRCYDIISDHELNERRGRKYEHIVIVRSDHWCTAQPFCLSKPEMEDKILVPTGMDWGGLNDRMIAFPRRAAKSILSGSWEKLTRNTRTEDFLSNTEFVHLSNVKDTNLPLLRTNATCFIACVPGASQTSWFPCSTLPPEVTQNDTTLKGAQGMKYRDEFLAAWNERTFDC